MYVAGLWNLVLFIRGASYPMLFKPVAHHTVRYIVVRFKRGCVVTEFVVKEFCCRCFWIGAVFFDAVTDFIIDNVAVAEESVSFLQQLENKKATKIPDTITFECEISDASATVEWLKEDRPLKKGDKYDLISDRTVRRLVINDVDGKDAGNYSVIFKNKTSKGTLTVEGTPSKLFLFQCYFCKTLCLNKF